MRYEYNFYTTDESFDYGDFPGGTCYQTGYHGFFIEMDKDYNIDITSLDSYGDYAGLEFEIKTLTELKDFLKAHLDEVQEIDNSYSTYSNREIFEELIEIINDNLQGKAA